MTEESGDEFKFAPDAKSKGLPGVEFSSTFRATILAEPNQHVIALKASRKGRVAASTFVHGAKYPSFILNMYGDVTGPVPHPALRK
jgi:hypothetical protein